eukprot:1852638-Amphidinium_carterae.1
MERAAHSGSASSVSPVTLDPAALEVTQNNRVDTTNMLQAVDIPVPEEDMIDENDVPYQGETQVFEDEPNGEPPQSLQEGHMEGGDEAGGEEETPEFDDEEEEDWVHEYNTWVPQDDEYENHHVGETHGRDYTLDRA